MIIEYTGRHTEVTQKLKTQAATGLDRIATLTGDACSAHVILTLDKYRHIAEITATCGSLKMVAICEASEMGPALHDALAKIEQQAVRHNQKATTIRRHPKDTVRTALVETPVETQATA
jgi:putative sigma-54 modulation protein